MSSIASGGSANPRESLGVYIIKTMIHTMVGHEATEPIREFVKTMNLSLRSYSGEDNDDKFLAWLSGLLLYCRWFNIVGESTEQDRVELLTFSLEGDASVWYFNHVASPSRQKASWTFEEVILALYQRFVITDVYAQAEARFHAVEYDSKRGVIGLREDLSCWARRMVDRPTEKAMLEKFVSCLPQEIVWYLFHVPRLDADSTPYEVWCNEAIRYEKIENLRLRRRVGNTNVSRGQTRHQ